MKVKDLILKLQSANPEAVVKLSSDEEGNEIYGKFDFFLTREDKSEYMFIPE